jgi:uncharacterized delta-60 repeat protein
VKPDDVQVSAARSAGKRSVRARRFDVLERPTLIAALALALSVTACNRTGTQDAGLDQQPALEQPGTNNPGDGGTQQPPSGGTQNPPTTGATPGMPEISFGDGGEAVVDLGRHADVPSGFDVGGSGRIIIVGGACDAASSTCAYATAALTGDGTLDASFGTNGIRRGEDSQGGSYELGRIDVIVQQGDGYVTLSKNGARAPSNLSGHTASGDVNPAFGNNPDLPGSAFAATGATNLEDDYSGRLYVLSNPASGSASLVRFTPTGKLDATFGDGGRAGFVNWNGLGDIALTGGHIAAVGGYGGSPTAEPNTGVARLLDSGAPDPAFGSGGYVMLGASPRLLATTIDSQGRTLALSGDRRVLRFNSDGSRDDSFDDSQNVPGSDWQPGEPSPWTMLEALTGDRVLVRWESRLVVLTSTGAVDSSFADAGVLSLPASRGGATYQWGPATVEGSTLYILGVRTNAGNQDGVVRAYSL